MDARSRCLVCLLGIFLTTGISTAATSADSPEAVYAKALKAYAAKDTRACLAALDTLHASGHHSPESWLLAGNARAKLGDETAAILGWRRALLLDPRLPEARQNLAVLVARNGIPEPAAPGRAMTMLSAIPRAVPLIACSIGLWLAVLGGTGMFLAANPALKSLAVASLAAGVLAGSTGAATAYAQFQVTRPSGPLPPRVWLADGQLAKPSALYSAGPPRRAHTRKPAGRHPAACPPEKRLELCRSPRRRRSIHPRLAPGRLMAPALALRRRAARRHPARTTGYTLTGGSV